MEIPAPSLPPGLSDRHRRLEAVASLPWLLDVVFSLAGRVRPHYENLPWELGHHPLVD